MTQIYITRKIPKSGLELLKEKNISFDIGSNKKSLNKKQIIKDFGIDHKKFSPSSVLSAISSCKSELITPADYEKYAQDYFQRTVAKIFPEYQKRLKTNDALDFDDLLCETINLFHQSPEVLEKYSLLAVSEILIKFK